MAIIITVIIRITMTILITVVIILIISTIVIIVIVTVINISGFFWVSTDQDTKSDSAPKVDRMGTCACWVSINQDTIKQHLRELTKGGLVKGGF